MLDKVNQFEYFLGRGPGLAGGMHMHLNVGHCVFLSHARDYDREFPGLAVQ